MKITVKVNDKEKSLAQTFPQVSLEYDGNVMLSKDDPTLKQYVEKVLKEFNGEPTKIKLTVQIEW